MVNHKTWNVRDQTEKNLRIENERIYKEIDRSYKLLRKLTYKEDAQKTIDYIWNMKSRANEIEMELMRRNINGETQNET